MISSFTSAAFQVYPVVRTTVVENADGEKITTPASDTNRNFDPKTAIAAPPVEPAPSETKNPFISANELTPEQQKIVEELKRRDAEVRAHEQAHAAVGGQYAGAPRYDYQTGPDGKKYAVGGQVSIDVSEESDPKDTIQKMQVVQRAALAPAEPSTQDYKVASDAAQKEQAARSELAKQNREQLQENKDPEGSSFSQSLINRYADIQNPRLSLFLNIRA